MRSSSTRLVLSWLIILVAPAGCAFLFGSSGPTVKTWVETTPAINFQSPVTKSGLTIEVKAIHEGNMEQFPRIMGEVDYAIRDSAGNIVKEKALKTSAYSWLPLAFQLKIANKTGHVVRFTGAVIKLVDAAGNLYDPISKEDLEAEWMGWDGKEVEAKYGTTEITSVNRMQSVVRKMKVLGPNTEILPDYTTEVYVGFGPHMPWMNSYDQASGELASLEQVKLMLYEVVTETDDAGNPVAKEKFEWAFDVVEKQEEVQK